MNMQNPCEFHYYRVDIEAIAECVDRMAEDAERRDFDSLINDLAGLRTNLLNIFGDRLAQKEQ
jgi:hypothetical protein